MSVPMVKGKFTEGFASVAETIRNHACWLGRKVSTGATMLWKSAASLWNSARPVIRDNAIKFRVFLKTPAGLAVMGGLLGVILNMKADNSNHKKLFQVAAAAAFVATGIAIGYGQAYGFNIVVI